jgi:hypothetical protein
MHELAVSLWDFSAQLRLGVSSRSKSTLGNLQRPEVVAGAVKGHDWRNEGDSRNARGNPCCKKAPGLEPKMAQELHSPQVLKMPRTGMNEERVERTDVASGFIVAWGAAVDDIREPSFLYSAIPFQRAGSALVQMGRISAENSP